MLWNKTEFQYINLEVAALQTLSRDRMQVNFNMSLYLRRYCNYFSQELWWDFFELWYFYSCNCSTIHKLHIKCPSSVNNFYLKEESKSIILRLKPQQLQTHYKIFHGNETFGLSWPKQDTFLCGQTLAAFWILLTSTRAHFPLEGNKQIFPQKGSNTLNSDVCCKYKNRSQKAWRYYCLALN